MTTQNTLGFLTIIQEGNTYVGGYLVTNRWGRPLEFRVTSAVQPNKVQQVLYASTLVPYVCADLIGKSLVTRVAIAVQLIVTDRREVLDLRREIETPVVYVAEREERTIDETLETPGVISLPNGNSLRCHDQYLSDVQTVQELLSSLNSYDLSEPFRRIREAIPETRRMGVGGTGANVGGVSAATGTNPTNAIGTASLNTSRPGLSAA